MERDGTALLAVTRTRLGLEAAYAYEHVAIALHTYDITFVYRLYTK
jgi:hypothetical protein